MKFLARKGAVGEIVDTYDNKPTSRAVENRRLDIFKLLIEMYKCRREE